MIQDNMSRVRESKLRGVDGSGTSGWCVDGGSGCRPGWCLDGSSWCVDGSGWCVPLAWMEATSDWCVDL